MVLFLCYSKYASFLLASSPVAVQYVQMWSRCPEKKASFYNFFAGYMPCLPFSAWYETAEEKDMHE